MGALTPGRMVAVTAALAAWTLLVAAGALVATRASFAAPPADLLKMALVFAATGAAGVALTLLLVARAERLPLAATVIAWTATALTLAGINVLGAARLMFLSDHDRDLLFIVLAHGLAVTAGPALVMAARVGGRARELEAGAERLGAGDLSARVPVEGRDELSRIAASFNAMAARLEEADRERGRLELARRDLFAAVSHDLRTPLSTMRAMIEALSDGVVSDEPTRARYLASVAGEIQRLSALIDDLFELARLDSGELQLHLDEVRVDRLVEEAIDTFRPAATQAGVRLEFEEGEAGVVIADAARVTRALYNLVQNAVRHTPPDGTVTVRTGRVTGGVEVAVTDTGEGIDADDLPHVFERFYRGERSRSRELGGAGLGLAIVRSIVEAHGGSVRAESLPATGSTFRIMLPSAR